MLFRLPPVAVAPLSLLLLLAVGVADYYTGPETSFTLLYLLPLTIAAWKGPKPLGLLVLMLAVVSRSIVLLFAGQLSPSLPVYLWNIAVFFGVLFTFFALLTEARRFDHKGVLSRLLLKTLLPGVALALVLAGAGLLLQPAKPHQSPEVTSAPQTPANLLLAFRDAYRELYPLSRSVLLGSRDPAASPCVIPVRTGEVGETPPEMPGDYDGGPGTKLAVLLFLDRQSITSPTQDFNYFQTRLRRYLTNEYHENALPLAKAVQLTELADRIVATVGSPFDAAPPNPDAYFAGLAGLTSIGFSERDTWIDYCLSEIDFALVARDPARLRRWATELRTAAFELADLHRWLDLLCQNFLFTLDLQQTCKDLFVRADAFHTAPTANLPPGARTTSPDGKTLMAYSPRSSPSYLPGGLVILHGTTNFYEVEHRAERLFFNPTDRIQALSDNPSPDPESLVVPPVARPAFMHLRAQLSSANARTWDLAARTPFEHTYLLNMISRADRVGTTAQLASALKALDHRLPNASMNELMDVLMYRGHSFAAVEWADRYQPRLLDTAPVLTSLTDSEALQAASRWTYNLYRKPQTSYGVTMTLRAAMESNRLDCVRATDMIGALYRNAGHTGFGHVRWVTEFNGHSVAAALTSAGSAQPVITLADGLDPYEPSPSAATSTQAVASLEGGVPTTTGPGAFPTWPAAYFHGATWPRTLPGNPTPYAAELYLRGLDNYLLAEAYVVRGPNAGTLLKTPLPYLPGRSEVGGEGGAGSSAKVYSGPYPE